MADRQFVTTLEVARGTSLAAGWVDPYRPICGDHHMLPSDYVHRDGIVTNKF